MIEIGGKPILWHIMKEYSFYGFNEFIICAGYKQHVIKEWFANYYLYNCDVTFDFADDNSMTVHRSAAEPWKVTVVDTGLNTMTGGRIKRIQKYVGNERFMLSYGDGVCDVNMNDILDFHEKHGKLATITAVNIGQRFGTLELTDNQITSFREKSDMDGSRINAGYMVMEPEVFDYIEGDKTVFEKEPMERLAADGQLMAYRYDGYWQCMDTKREHDKLEELWDSGKAPWKTW
jgi:glucose-1-phosphate cytidylyltransferase